MNRAENRRAPPGRARRDEVAANPRGAAGAPKAPAWSPREGLLDLRWVTRRGPEPSRPPRVPTGSSFARGAGGVRDRHRRTSPAVRGDATLRVPGWGLSATSSSGDAQLSAINDEQVSNVGH